MKLDKVLKRLGRRKSQRNVKDSTSEQSSSLEGIKMQNYDEVLEDMNEVSVRISA